ncbi:MAG TPA: alpha/beta hydrolase [Dehalococcoidia bacterium]
MSQPESRYYASQRLKLHYVVWGDESLPPLLLIHGRKDHARNWDRVALALQDRFAIYAPDLRGHGDSDWVVGGHYSHPEFVIDVAALVEHLGRSPVTVIGHSMGAGIALQYAGLYQDRVRRVVAIEGLGPPFRPRRPAPERMRQWIDKTIEVDRREVRRYPSLEAAARRMLEENPRLTPEMAHHLTLHGSRRLEDGSYTWKFDPYLNIHSPYEFNLEDAREIWHEIRCPVLHIRGADSWGGDPLQDGRAAAFRDARFVTIQHAGHWVHHDQLEQFLAVTQEFLLQD